MCKRKQMSGVGQPVICFLIPLFYLEGYFCYPAKRGYSRKEYHFADCILSGLRITHLFCRKTEAAFFSRGLLIIHQNR